MPRMSRNRASDRGCGADPEAGAVVTGFNALLGVELLGERCMATICLDPVYDPNNQCLRA